MLSPYILEIPLLNSDSSCRYRTRFDLTKATRRWTFSFWPASANGGPFGPCLSASETIVTGLIVASFLDICRPHNLEIILSLQVNPELRACARIARKKKRSFSADCPFTVDDLRDAQRRYTKIFGYAVSRQVQGLHEVLKKDFTGMNWA